MFQLRMPVGIRQSTLQKVSNRPTAADAIKSAVGVKAFEHIRLEPDLNRFGLGVTAGAKAAIRITGWRAGQFFLKSKGFTASRWI